MFKNYFKIAWRNLLKDRMSSVINIGGLAVGMAVALLIGFWIYDELNFNKSFKNYDHIATLMQHQTANGNISTFNAMPLPLGEELQTNYGNNFKYVVMSSWMGDGIITSGEKNLSRRGMFMDVDALRMFSLTMIEGTYDGLKYPNSIIISSSTAKAFFGNEEPMNKLMKIGNKLDVKVTGVFKDMPINTDLAGLDYISPWSLYLTSEKWIMQEKTQWDDNSFQIYVQVADHVDFNAVDKNIIHSKNIHDAPEDKKHNAQIFLNPMRDWHLRTHFEDGIRTGGPIEYVKLFSIIGVFVLLLACINFMNLSTARSEKRAKEVGIRKSIGSLRGQLVTQFYIESLLIVVLSFALSLLFVQLILPWFNEVADKKMVIPWANPYFWIGGLGFSFITGIFAGSYPALYLSSFQPIKVLKGTFKVGRLAAIPRQVLVVMQFSISLALIIGTIVVFDQIQFSKDRPIGYDRNGLLMIRMKTPDFYGKFDLLENELKSSGTIEKMAESSSPLTDVYSSGNQYTWPGRDPKLDEDFETVWVTHDYGKAISWQFKEGRDFSKDFKSDSSAIVLNESAVKYMGLKNPVGTVVKRGLGVNAKNFIVIGVIKDMLMESPYEAVKQTIYYMDYENVNWIILKLNPNKSATQSLVKVESVFKKYIPSVPFDYKFADKEFASKFAAEERIGVLSTFFAALAIFISCLGLFGLASFVAEQRTKEIGVRKVLGASLFDLWRLLSKDFLLLVAISLLIAIPVSYYFMSNWLLHYPYRTNISWWVFGISGVGAMLITLLTVSFQAIKAAVVNPVKSLRTE
ncbi:MAG TPA: ABC transporter permease [Puia sp.]|nr:ABC transporter permease [Puia sp.]